ncbi:GNAT family acetyltransferase [Paracoccaceae bacterium]|nr:GNAT family acetyltransferase [Paracoccaceae bacterium]
MVDKNSSNFSIRKFDISDSERVVNIWSKCELVRDWNNSESDIQRKLSFQEELFFVGELENQIIAIAMFGYYGHRGWLNYFAVALDFQTKGYGKLLLHFGEQKLLELGCAKINLQIRNDNKEAVKFYHEQGYKIDAVISLGKRLIHD